MVLIPNGKNAKETTKGLNEAIECASNNSISYIKLEKGEYLVNNSIELFSNLEFDLNSSDIIMDTNDMQSYSILKIANKENIKVLNGKIEGDRESHNYTGNSSHAWGMGVRISGSKNINVDNVEILNMTGDGIYITSGLSNSDSVQIQNCLIHDNRRQGISIISGRRIKINNNEIYNIKGISPQAGIDLEANKDTQKIDEIEIQNNKIYLSASNTAIILYNQVYNVKITENIIYGNININETKEKTEILNNELIDGKINAGSTNEDSAKIVNNLDILNNELNNYEIEYNNKVNNINIDGNQKTE